ncbi:MAG: bifunctional phosphopantothenoylcysteine decarboxylase/phosphopantothenate--cysteine ligase CoaBC [Acidimicrobiales bacterium]
MHVVLGVCGGIAAYKAVELCRRLVERGAFVSPVMTVAATRFVGAVTLSAVASEAVRTSLWDGPEPIPHTVLGRAADAVVVAPATAHLLASYAAGLADDLLTATLLATRAPVVLCPAMHAEMWEHPATRDNMARLQSRGATVVGPAVGPLAGGDDGPGRLAEPADIVAAVEAVLCRTGDLTGRRVVVTAGGTREPIDPVRFLGNRSSGKQGHALAAEARHRGARVTLVTTAEGPVPPGVEVVRVATAAEMEAALMPAAARADIVVMAAAVADFRPKAPADRKLAKSDGVPDLVLEPTPDLLVGLGRRRPPGQVLVGFAAETDDLAARARAKLVAKGLDLIVANDVSRPGAGFGHDTNEVLLLGADGSEQAVPLSSKREVARAVLDAVVEQMHRTRAETIERNP